MKTILGILALLLLPSVASADVIYTPPPTNNLAQLLHYNELVILIARYQTESYAYCLGHDDTLRGMGYETGIVRNEDVLDGQRAGDWQRHATLVPIDLQTFYNNAKELGEMINRNQPVVDDCFARVAAVETAIANVRRQGLKKPGKGK